MILNHLERVLAIRKMRCRLLDRLRNLARTMRERAKGVTENYVVSLREHPRDWLRIPL